MATQDILTSDPLLLVPGLVGRMNGLVGAGARRRAAGRIRARLGADAGLAAGRRGAGARVRGRGPGAGSRQGGGARRRAAVDRDRPVCGRQPGADRARDGDPQPPVAGLRARGGGGLREALLPGGPTSCRWSWARSSAPGWRPPRRGSACTSSCLSWAPSWPGSPWTTASTSACSRGGAPASRYLERASRLMRPLLASALTTVIGFSFLLWSELPLIRQLGVFVSAGLVCALVTALLWFAQVDDSYIETRGVRPPATLGESGALARRARPHPPCGRRRRGAPRPVAAALEGRHPRARDSDAGTEERTTPRCRALFGETPGRTVYLTQGPDAGGRRASPCRLPRWHGVQYPGRPGRHPRLRASDRGAVGPPSRAARRAWAVSSGTCARALARHGFDAGRIRAVLRGVVRRAPADASARPTTSWSAGSNAALQGPARLAPPRRATGCAGSPPSPSSRRAPTRPP